MANTTVYPYGTDGELPSSIGLVNDLNTGGADKALTAEMGRYIGKSINVIEDCLVDCVEHTDTQVTDYFPTGCLVDGNQLWEQNTKRIV